MRLSLAAVACLLAVLIAASYLGDEPLRRTIERNMNRSLKGYSASVGHAHLRLFGLSVTLRDVSVAQQANPVPPVIAIPFLKASVHWKELLTLHLVADFLFERPELHVNRPQLLKEAADATPVNERGWQEALESIYPLKINLLRIDDASLTYIDDEKSEPLRVTHLKIRATNIRNIRSKEHDYPSPLEAEGVILGSGHGKIRGHANFLAEPTPGVHVLFDLVDVPLTPFRPLVQRSNLVVRSGIVSTSGELEFAPGIQAAHVENLTIRKVSIEYLHKAATSGAEKQTAETVKKAARDAAASPQTDLRLERLKVADSEIAFVNEARNPPYRVYVSDFTLTASNWSNGLKAGPAAVQATGRFMGSGPADVKASFRPGAKADFDVAVAIRDTDLRRMNDILRSYGRFEVAEGTFSFFCELAVRNGTMDGYVKPLFRDIKVADSRKDTGFFHKAYEHVVQGVATLLKNRQRKEVATKAAIKGPIDNPKASTVQVVLKLVENAFFRAILPGFDKEAAREGAAAASPSRAKPAGSGG